MKRSKAREGNIGRNGRRGHYFRYLIAGHSSTPHIDSEDIIE